MGPLIQETRHPIMKNVEGSSAMNPYETRPSSLQSKANEKGIRISGKSIIFPQEKDQAKGHNGDAKSDSVMRDDFLCLGIHRRNCRGKKWKCKGDTYAFILFFTFENQGL